MMTFLMAVDDMAVLLAAWSVVALTHYGWGVWVGRLAQGRAPISPTAAFWGGFVGIVVFLQLWHLWLPITGITTGIVIAIGGAGLLVQRGALPARPAWVWLAVATVLALLLANHALRPAIFYDNGLYHIPTVAWIKQFPIVIGLGNVYGPLAFNNSYFLPVALWDGVVAGLLGSQLLNGLLTLALALEGLNALAQMIAARRVTPPLLLSALLLYPLINLAFDPLANYLSGPTTDYVVWVLTLKAGIEAFRILDSATADSSRFVSLVVLASGLITLKLSAAVFAAVLLMVVGITLVWRRWLPLRRMIGTFAVVGALTIAPWMVRTALVSGYLLYPTTVGGLPVAWRVADEQALEDTNDVRAWSRYPVVGSRWQEVLSNDDWFESWQVNFWQTRGIRLSLLVGVVAWGIVGVAAVLRQRLPATVRHLLLWLLPSLASVLFWFVSAPSPRYVPVYFWLIAMGGVVGLLASLPAAERLAERVFAVRSIEYAAAAGLLVLMVASHGFQWQRERVPLPAVEVRRFTTFSGLELYVPTADDLCWDAPLPCTPYPNGNLRLREPGNMGAGFTVRP